MRLKEKVAIITGTSQGIGEATAARFAEEGAVVILVARREKELARVSSNIDESGGKAFFYPVDVSDESAVKQLIEDVVLDHGKLDILVNNAVFMIPGSIARLDLSSWNKNFKVSLDAAFLLMREAFPYLSESCGAVVNVSSVCGLLGSIGTAGYSAAKAGLLALTRNAAIEWGSHGVRVNAVIPGAFLTPPTLELMPDNESREATARSLPLGRIGNPVECANAILFLASTEASYVTGAELIVDGGRTAELVTGTASWD